MAKHAEPAGAKPRLRRIQFPRVQIENRRPMLEPVNPSHIWNDSLSLPSATRDNDLSESYSTLNPSNLIRTFNISSSCSHLITRTYTSWRKTSGGSPGMREITRTLLDPVCPPTGDRLTLDAGCGTGGMMSWLKRYAGNEPPLESSASLRWRSAVQSHMRLLYAERNS